MGPGLTQPESTVLNNTVVHAQIPLTISFEELERIPALNCRGLMRPKIARILQELLASITTGEILMPAASYRIVDVERATAESLNLADGTELSGPLLIHKIKAASMVMATATTLGCRVGELVEHSFKTGKHLKAVLLEEIANFALFKLNEQLLEVAIDEAASRGLLSSGPLCPGNEGFDLLQQKNMLHLADAASLGIHLSRTSFITPRHSHTQLVGFGKRMKMWGYADNCSSCKARGRCPHLKVNEQF
jgi:hypothetical protein